MKKITIYIFLGLILLTGCTKKEEKYKEYLKEYATTFYSKYMKGIENQDQAEITIGMLKQGIKQQKDTYDLSKLKNCKDETSVVLSLNSKKEIIKYEYNLKCE